jgi:hypothetical protein
MLLKHPVSFSRFFEVEALKRFPAVGSGLQRLPLLNAFNASTF